MSRRSKLLKAKGVENEEQAGRNETRTSEKEEQGSKSHVNGRVADRSERARAIETEERLKKLRKNHRRIERDLSLWNREFWQNSISHETDSRLKDKVDEEQHIAQQGLKCKELRKEDQTCRNGLEISSEGRAKHSKTFM